MMLMMLKCFFKGIIHQRKFHVKIKMLTFVTEIVLHSGRHL
jgi:hypothetical protein